jgi:hypothetical protein
VVEAAVQQQVLVAVQAAVAVEIMVLAELETQVVFHQVKEVMAVQAVRSYLQAQVSAAAVVAQAQQVKMVVQALLPQMAETELLLL